MRNSKQRKHVNSRHDSSSPMPPELADIIERIMQQASADEEMDLEAYCERFPAWAERIREVGRTVLALADFRNSSSESTSRSASIDDPLHDLRGVLGDFEILREIGRGGMGIVYEAEQLSLNRRVALKVLPFASLLDQRRLTRFQNEARAAAMLKHPNIVSVHSVGCERGIHYYAMDLIDGQSLAHLNSIDLADSCDRHVSAKDAQFDSARQTSETKPIAALSTQLELGRKSRFRRIASLGVQAANALHYSHQQGVVHRDIKPSNLLLDKHGQLHVADFGLARIQSGDDLTMTGDVLGTLRYMSPEQLDGMIVDERTDVYSLGVTLYQLLTGRPAFQAEHQQELTRSILETDPVRPTKLIPEFPTDLETVVLRAVSKEKENRYQSALELSEDLQRFIENRPIHARKPTLVGAGKRWVSRNRVVTALLASVVFLLLSLVGLSTATAVRLARDAQEKEIRLYGQDMRLAHEAVRRGDFVSAEEMLLSWTPQSSAVGGSEDHRGFEWNYLWRACHHPAIERTIAHKLAVFDAVFLGYDTKLAVAWWSNFVPFWDLDKPADHEPIHRIQSWNVVSLHYLPQENRLLTGGFKGGLREWDVESGELLYKDTLEADRHGVNHVWSLSHTVDHELIAVGAGRVGDGCLAIWNRKSREWVYRVDLQNPCIAQFGAGNRVYFAEHESRKLSMLDLITHRVEEFDLGISGLRCMTMTDDRRQFIVAANPNDGSSNMAHLVIWDVDEQRVVAQRAVGQRYLQAVTVSKDSETIALGDRDGKMFLFDRSTLELKHQIQAHSGRIYSLEFSNDGRRLVSCSSDNYARIWNVEKLMDRTGNRRTLQETVTHVGGSDFVDDETVVSSNTDGRVIFWDARTGRPTDVISLPHSDTNRHQLVVSPDHRKVAVNQGHWPRSKSPGYVHMLDVETQQVLWSNEVKTGIGHLLTSFSADGHFVAAKTNGVVLIMDTLSGRVEHSLLHGEHVKATRFSSDGRWCACGTYKGQIHLFSMPDFEKHRVIDSGGQVCEDVAFSPDGKTLATIDFDNRVKLFDIRSGQRIPRDFKTSPAFMAFVRYSPNGKRLVTGGLDGKVRLWHAHTGDELLSLDIPPGVFSVGNFSPDGRSLVIGSGPNAIVFSGDRSESLRRLSKAKLEEIACTNLSIVERD